MSSVVVDADALLHDFTSLNVTIDGACRLSDETGDVDARVELVDATQGQFLINLDEAARGAILRFVCVVCVLFICNF